MPGSRRKEIEMLLPIYLSAVDEMNLKDRFQLVVPTTKNMTKLVKTIIENYSLCSSKCMGMETWKN